MPNYLLERCRLRRGPWLGAQAMVRPASATAAWRPAQQNRYAVLSSSMILAVKSGEDLTRMGNTASLFWGKAVARVVATFTRHHLMQSLAVAYGHVSHNYASERSSLRVPRFALAPRAAQGGR
jgi:hypothetical protein